MKNNTFKTYNGLLFIFKWGKKVESKIIKRIQDRRGKNNIQFRKQKLQRLRYFLKQNESLLKITDDEEQIISKETAYQITSMLEGAVIRGTGKKLKNSMYHLVIKQVQQMIIMMPGL